MATSNRTVPSLYVRFDPLGLVYLVPMSKAQTFADFTACVRSLYADIHRRVPLSDIIVMYSGGVVNSIFWNEYKRGSKTFLVLFPGDDSVALANFVSCGVVVGETSADEDEGEGEGEEMEWRELHR